MIMIQQLSHVLLLAEHRVVDMGRHFRQGGAEVQPRDFMTLATILLSAVLAVWLLACVANRQQRRYHPRLLFTQLCEAHKLDWRSRWLLHRLARANRLEHPAQLFLEPEWFDRAHLRGHLAKQPARIERLRDRLFSRQVG